MSDSIIIAGMEKKSGKTVPVHARIAESDVAVVDKAAEKDLTTRSNIIARIIRQWVKAMGKSKK